MNNAEIMNIFANCKIEGEKIITDKQTLHDLLVSVKDKYGYNVLKQIIATDYADEGTEITYHLFSVTDEEDLIISIITYNSEAVTVTDLFDSAKADENEIYDMFGINFMGNEDLKRLYMPESWEGFPLRKDYIQDDTRLAWNDNDDI